MFDIIKKYPKVDSELVKKFAMVKESASINECLKANGAMSHHLRPVWPGSRFCGVAFTVSARPGDNLILHKAISLLKPGDALIVTCDGFLESGGMWGGIMSSAAQKMGAVALVIDGSVRDTMHMKEIGFPVFSCGINVKRSTKAVGGTINHPITICGVQVHPGDLVFGDNDAVVVVPREEASQVYEAATKREAHEENSLINVQRDGTFTFYGNEFHKTFAALGLSEEED